MKRNHLFAIALGVAIGAGSWAIADSSKDAPATELKLPAGWTMEDMQACIAAGTPGEMQQEIMKDAGTWHGKANMWMSPDGEPMQTEIKMVATPIMDGRYLKVEMSGDMPGMGPYTGLGYYGYDNVAKQLVGSWIDNHSTGIMSGAGKVSEGGKVVTYTYTFNCPITKKPATVRDVETTTGADTKTYESFSQDPKSGKEFRMMRVELTRGQ